MKYTEVDIKLEKIIPFSEILIAKLDEIGYDSYEENKLGVMTPNLFSSYES